MFVGEFVSEAWHRFPVRPLEYLDPESARELFIIWKFRVEIGEAFRACIQEAARNFGRLYTLVPKSMP
ncbi:MAG: hypothetical protein OXE82_13740 [Rhodobacter sp.]|nr:hypothetical protein [Rhodobacter sp.]